jgi:hypothetical protein
MTDNHFHNTGVPAAGGLPDDNGRAEGARLVLEDEFNCLGPYSDAAPEDCAELRFMAAPAHDALRAFKTPSAAWSGNPCALYARGPDRQAIGCRRPLRGSPCGSGRAQRTVAQVTEQ